MRKLRPYQEEAVKAIEEHWKEWQRELLVLATGLGKTVCAWEIAKRHSPGVLFLCHREELLDQAQDKFEAPTGKIKAEENTILPITVGSVQTMSRRKYDPDLFNTIIVDEAHHAVSDTYLSVLNQFPNAKVLGLTATPDRLDRKSLAKVFDGIAYEYGIKEGVRDGYLCPIQARTIPLEIDISDVKVSVGDFEVNSIAEHLEPYLPQIAENIKKYASDRKTIVFMPLISIAQEFTTILQNAGMNAREVNGQSPDRKEILEWFNTAPKGSVLINSALLLEGYDCPTIDCVVMLRPTKSRSLYCLDTKTEILTDEGWMGINNFDRIKNCATFDRETGEIRYVPIQAKVKRPLYEDEYFVSLSSPTVDIRVTNKHRMVYDTRRKSGWKFKTAEEIADLKCGCRIPIAGHKKFKGVPLTDDEIRFLAWVATDGSINKYTNAIQISQAEHQPWLQEIPKCLDGCNLKYGVYKAYRKTQFHENSRNVIFSISKGEPRGTQKDRRGWGYLERYVSKEIPPALREMSDEQFAIYLETCHLADGHKQEGQSWTRRSYHIGKGSKKFIEQLQILAIQHGYKANMSVETKNRERPYYTLHIKKKDFAELGSKFDGRPTWVKEPHNFEICWCVQNELGTLITRRNGKVAIVGNCQAVGRGTRLADGKENLLLLDFLWLCQRHNLCRPASLASDNDEDIKRVVKKTTEEQLDLFDAVTDAEEARKNALAEALRKQTKKKSRLVNPFDLFDILDDIGLADYEPTFEWENADASQKQIECLANFGIDAEGITKGYACKIMDTCISRSRHKMATIKQVRTLKKFGYHEAPKWTFEQANKKISQLAACGWQRWRIHDN